MSRYRTVQSVTEAPLVQDGEGVAIHRAFPNAHLSEFDPFLLLDHMGPMDLKPGEAKGFPDHPHRGFETVTYLLEGEFEHRDSFGHHGILKAGDVQWMTAGSGLVHSETPGRAVKENGGKLEGFQVWINLPQRDKMKPPHYQEFGAVQIPVVRGTGVEAKVIAGEAMDVKGAVTTHIPIQFVHFKLEAGASVVHRIARELNAMAYVIHGAIEIGGRTVPRFHLAGLANDGDGVEIRAVEKSDFLLLAAQPIGEPVVRYGPFVMNTEVELRQAFDDYRTGKMGRI
jgi:redox-sensitive bicupin YhaK (pirin superfamily)